MIRVALVIALMALGAVSAHAWLIQGSGGAVCAPHQINGTPPYQVNGTPPYVRNC
jgi:hypothetical protein